MNKPSDTTMRSLGFSKHKGWWQHANGTSIEASKLHYRGIVALAFAKGYQYGERRALEKVRNVLGQ